MPTLIDQHEEHTIKLAKFAASLQFSAVPEDFQRLLRVFILDTTSAMVSLHKLGPNRTKTCQGADEKVQILVVWRSPADLSVRSTDDRSLPWTRRPVYRDGWH